MAVAQNYYAVLWFKGRELNMIFGLQLSFARVGSAVNFITMGHLYDLINQYFKGREALGVTLLVGQLIVRFCKFNIFTNKINTASSFFFI